MLATLRHPAASPDGSVPLVIVHGLYGSARNWNAMARRLATTRDVIAVDQRNHGESPHLAAHSYADMAADITEVIASLGAEVDLMGHSMGGKAAMLVALRAPERVRRLIVADIAPVVYTHDQSQYARAMMALDLSDLSTRAEADRRLSASVDDPALRAFFLQSLDLKAEGGPRWRLNLPQLEASMPEIVGWPEGVSGTFEKPTLFLTGGDSTYVLPQHREPIRALFPHARFAKINGAGHWLQADKPREFEDTVRFFFDR